MTRGVIASNPGLEEALDVFSRTSRLSKRLDFSPAQPRRLLHPPALSLPRQPLRPGTRLVPCKAAASEEARRVDLVHLVCLVHLVGLVQPNKRDKPNNSLITLADFSRILLAISPAPQLL